MRTLAVGILSLMACVTVGCASADRDGTDEAASELGSGGPGSGFPMGVFTPGAPGPAAYGPPPVPGPAPQCTLVPPATGKDAHPNLPIGPVDATFALTHDFVPTASLGPRRYVSTCRAWGQNPGVVQIECKTGTLEMSGVVDGDHAALEYRGKETRKTVDRASLAVTFYRRCDSVWALSDFSREKRGGRTLIDDRYPLPQIATVIDGTTKLDRVWETTGQTCDERCAARGQRCLQGSVLASHWGASCTFSPHARLASCGTHAIYTVDACAPFLECECTE